MNMIKKHVFLFTSLVMFVCFLVWTILVKTVDVEPFYSGTDLGFHSLNFAFGDFVTEYGKYEGLRTISDILLFVSFGYVALLGGIGIYQWIKLKSLKKVNPIFFFLAGAYVLVVLCYVFFELVVVNYGPDTSEGLKASYPSSHVLIGVSFYLLSSFTLMKFLHVENETFKTLIHLSTVVLCLLTVFTRLFSARHWCTDIIGSVLLSLSIYFFFIGMCRKFIPSYVINLSEDDE